MAKVTCMICNKELQIISNLHLKTHNTDIIEYKKKYPDAKLFSEEYSTMRREKAAEQFTRQWSDSGSYYVMYNRLYNREVIQRREKTRIATLQRKKQENLDKNKNLQTL